MGLHLWQIVTMNTVMHISILSTVKQQTVVVLLITMMRLHVISAIQYGRLPMIELYLTASARIISEPLACKKENIYHDEYE